MKELAKQLHHHIQKQVKRITPDIILKFHDPFSNQRLLHGKYVAYTDAFVIPRNGPADWTIYAMIKYYPERMEIVSVPVYSSTSHTVSLADSEFIKIAAKTVVGCSPNPTHKDSITREQSMKQLHDILTRNIAPNKAIYQDCIDNTVGTTIVRSEKGGLVLYVDYYNDRLEVSSTTVNPDTIVPLADPELIPKARKAILSKLPGCVGRSRQMLGL